MWRLRPGPGRGSAPRLRAASGGLAGPGCGPCTILARLSAPLGLGQWPLSMPTGLPATQVWCHVTTSPCLHGKCHDSGTRPQPPPAAGWVALACWGVCHPWAGAEPSSRGCSRQGPCLGTASLLLDRVLQVSRELDRVGWAPRDCGGPSVHRARGGHPPFRPEAWSLRSGAVRVDAEALLTLVFWLEGANQAQGERAGARPIPTSIVDTPTSGPGPVGPFLLPVYR